MRGWFGVARQAAGAWVDDFAPSMGAAISYYTMFSLAPLLVLVIALAGLVFGADAVQGQVAAQLSGLMGPDTAEAVQDMIQSAAISDNGLMATLLSIGVLVLGATTVFAELQSALDRIWHVPERDKPAGLWGILRARVFSFGLILGLAFLLIVSLSISTLLSAFGGLLGGLMPGEEAMLHGLSLGVSVAVTTALFAMIFKFMPTARVAWRDVWVGAAVTAVLFELGKFLIGLYLGKSGMADAFAGAGSLVLLLAWVYYAAQIFLLGAEFTKVYAQTHGSVAGDASASPDRAAAALPGAALVDAAKGDTETTSNRVTEVEHALAVVEARLARAQALLVPRLGALAALTAVTWFTERRLHQLRTRRRATARAS